MHACLLVVGDNVEEQLKLFVDTYAFADRPKDVPRKPNEKFDFFIVGGRWKEALELREPRQERWLFGLLPKSKTKTHTAKKSEIKEESLFRNPPVSVLIDGVWEDADFVIGQPTNEKWLKRFEQIFRSIPESVRLTMVDYHA
jgi:hypothetical protein